MNGNQPAPAKKPARRAGVSLTLAMTASVGTLLVLTVVAVTALSLWNARQSTIALLREQARLAVSTSVARIEQHLRPATDQVAFIGDLLESGALGPAEEARFSATFAGALATAPQITTLVFIDPAHRLFGVQRLEGAFETYKVDGSKDRVTRRAIAAARQPGPAVWGPPVWREAYRTTLLNLRRPIHRGERLLGLLVATISIGELSDYIADLDGELGDNAFILYDRRQVLAHALLADRFPGLSEAKPLPDVENFSDPVLAEIWRAPRAPVQGDLPEGIEGFTIETFNDRYVFLYRNVTGFSDRPWQVGAYFRTEDVDEYFDRLRWTAMAGGVALIIALAAALVLSRSIARPIGRLARAANRVGRLELADLSELPRSRFRELDDQASAFNAMLSGLRWFEVYVPKALVRRLMERDGDRQLASAEREVTVMFTDIAGFTRIAEGTDAEALAGFLNDHFAIIATAVEAEGGTVDKFIGDAVMAFWGAPEDQPDHAELACRAALAIRDAIEADNERRRTAGETQVRMRIGLHTGRAVVGNIGAPGRMNYTIVGDTVNVAQRLEQLAKETPADDVGILVSQETADRLGEVFALEPAGEHRVSGRNRPVAAFRLI